MHLSIALVRPALCWQELKTAVIVRGFVAVIRGGQFTAMSFDYIGLGRDNSR
ncbi:MAG: hypothetical protein ACI9G5_002719 [Paracoccaceae bacterium]